MGAWTLPFSEVAPPYVSLQSMRLVLGWRHFTEAVVLVSGVPGGPVQR